jgi:hypothetical protein
LQKQGPGIIFQPAKTAYFMIETSTLEKAAHSGISRRRFFGYAGALAGAGILVSTTGCQKEEDPGLNIGAGDSGVLNYLYIMKQLEAAFYIQVMTLPFIGINDTEKVYFTDIRNHEIAHREFLKNLLGGAGTSAVEFDFNKIDFAKRTSVLDTAIMFEDLGVSACNGAASLLTSADSLMALAKMASVEARHAAALRDLKLTGTFADDTVVNEANGLDLVRVPDDVLAILSPYIKTKLNTTNLPKG